MNYIHKSFDSIDQLPEIGKIVVKQAQAQLKFAYAPYSNFYVGAAIILESGEVYGGCNQENASYPLCICAERVALYSMGAQMKTFNIQALAVTAHNPRKKLMEPCMPCGACRQVIQEYESRQEKPIDIYITAYELDKILLIKGIGAILPSSFGKEHLI